MLSLETNGEEDVSETKKLPVFVFWFLNLLKGIKRPKRRKEIQRKMACLLFSLVLKGKSTSLTGL